MKPVQLIALVIVNLAVSFGFSQDKSSDYLTKEWKDVAIGMPSEWYGSEKAKLVAENILLSQKEIGGWVLRINPFRRYQYQ